MNPKQVAEIKASIMIGVGLTVLFMTLDYAGLIH